MKWVPKYGISIKILDFFQSDVGYYISFLVEISHFSNHRVVEASLF